MPKKIEQVFYKCDVCGKSYYHIEDAEFCESEHAHVEKIEKEVFSNVETPEKYPRRILAKFTDGKSIYYGITDMPSDL